MNAYNEVASQVNAQIGTAAGLLSGDALIRQTQSALRSLTTYSSGDGNVQSLANLGIEFDNKGVASFKSSTFTALSDADIAEALTFLGSTTTGFGGLSAAFTQIGDPITGFIRAQQDQYDRTDQRLTEQVDALTDRINLMQSALSQKLQLADTLLASLASQQDILKGSLESLNYVTFGKRSS